MQNEALPRSDLTGEVQKPRMLLASDPALIDAIRRDELHDPIGGNVGGAWLVVADWRLERWREVARRATDSQSGPHT